MALLYKPGAGNPALWKREIARHLPDLEIRDWSDPGDPADIEFVLLFRGEPGALRRFPNLKAILSTGAGVDGIMADPDLPPGVPISRIVDPWMSIRMSQWVVHAVLHFARQMPGYEALQQRREWRELHEEHYEDRPVGILGCGAIGSMAGGILAQLGFAVTGWTRSPRDLGPLANAHGADGLPGFLRQSEFLVCLLPLTDETRGILNRETLALLPPGAFVINAARGGHIVAADLIEALDAGRLGGAFLDVTVPEPLPADDPLWRHPKVKLTPHVAGITNPLTATAQVCENIRRALAGEPLLNTVDRASGY